MRFDPVDGSRPTQSTVETGILASPPENNPVRDGFRFDGWTLNGQPFDFQTPILQDTTLKAQWSKTTNWTLNPDHGPASGTQLTISPPDPQEPYYVNVQAAGDQVVGLTGDGRIYTWMQDSTPKQVAFPAQAPDGFHYVQAAADNRWQAALGSDQQIYTWSRKQATPKILNTDQNTKFTSISMDDDRLLAVDQHGQVHAFQASQFDTRNPIQKPVEQATVGLPGQAHAVLAVSAGSRSLAMDTDGYAWTLQTTSESTKPVRIKQDPGMRITQTQALNQGFLLLDSNGQTRYLADDKTSMTMVSLPDGGKASQITANKDLAIITDTDGQVWSWEPGDTPVRSSNDSQPYTQATEVGNGITAVDQQGSIFMWSLNARGNPSKPARLNTTSTPILESASMDGQPLKISKKHDAWQADAPAHRAGQAAITITGRQDSQPFTKSLNYTVDQLMTRDVQTGSTYTVSFDTAGGSQSPDLQQVPYPYGRAQRPSPDPTRKDYRFDGWFIDEVAYDFSKPVTENLTLTAKWTRQDPNNTWRINPDKGSQLGKETTTITPPSSTSGAKFNQVSGSGTNYFSLAVGSDGNAYAWGYNKDGELGDGTRTNRNTPVVVMKPDSKTYPDRPADFTYVQVSAGTDHSLALGSDGYVYAWGDDTDGELGNKTIGSSSSVPVRVRDPANPNDTSKGLKAIQVSAGRDHSLAVDKDGNAWAWGSNGYGRLGNNSSSSYSTLPVRVRDPGDPSNSNKGLNVMQVSAGDWHSLAVDKDGNTWAWGRNDYGQLGNGQISSSWDAYPVPQKVLLDANDASTGLKTLQVSAGGSLSLAIDQDGSTWAWGHNNSGQLGNGTSNGRNQNPIPSPVLLNPKNASTRLKAVQVSAGWGHSLAIGEDGNTWAWGDNSSGQLGNNGSSYQYYSPVKVLATKQSTNSAGPWLDATQISAGSSHSLAICKDGSARAWGNNSYTQLGNTDAGSRSLAPVPVMFNLQPAITGVKFDQTTVSILTHNKDDNSVSVTTPAHEPGQILVSVSYTLGGIVQKPVSLTYTYIPLGVLPQAGGEGVLLALATGTMSIGGMLASRRHRTERLQLLQALHE